MSTTHHLSPVEFSGIENQSVAYWAHKPAKDPKLVVFLHGFRGEAVTTWVEFDRLLIADKKGEGTDVIFFGYDGLTRPASESAEFFYKALKSLCTEPQATIRRSLPELLSKRITGFQYQDVIIVAHSLGAIIARLALLIAYRRQAPWAAKTKLVLFAPAHNGTRGFEFLAQAITGLPVPGLGSILALWEARWAVIKDLKEDSRTLERLRDDIESLRTKSDATFLRAKAVIWANKDSIVVNGYFPGDPEPESYPCGHIAICKPSAAFKAPLKHVLDQL